MGFTQGSNPRVSDQHLRACTEPASGSMEARPELTASWPGRVERTIDQIRRPSGVHLNKVPPKTRKNVFGFCLVSRRRWYLLNRASVDGDNAATRSETPFTRHRRCWRNGRRPLTRRALPDVRTVAKLAPPTAGIALLRENREIREGVHWSASTNPVRRTGG